MTFRDVGRHRYGCSLHLVNEPEFLSVRQNRCQFVYFGDRLNRFLPYLKLGVFHRARLSTESRILNPGSYSIF